MHSSRMRTVRCSGRLFFLGGGVSAQGCVSAQWGVSARGGVSAGGCLPKGVNRITDRCLDVSSEIN